MTLKLLGAILTVIGCGGMGLRVAAAYRREISALEQLYMGIDYMECELRYRMPPLPALCDATSHAVKGPVGAFFSILSVTLGKHVSPRVRSCVEEALGTAALPDTVKGYISILGDTLGQFDLEGQLQGLSNLREQLANALENRRKDQGNRMRIYQTLGLCAGAAIAILLL